MTVAWRDINIRETVAPAYKKAWRSRKRWLILWGGAGSGKSWFCAQKLLGRLLREEGHKLLALHKYDNKVRSTVWAQLILVMRAWGIEDEFDVGTSPFVIRCKSNGSEIHGLGMDDPEKVKSIPGITGGWIEEATNFMPNDIMQLNLRLRGETKYFKQFMLSLNPIDSRHFIRRKFFLDPPPNSINFHTTWRDNPFLDEEYLAELQRLTGNDALIYERGEWGLLEGLIYPGVEFAPIPEKVYDFFYGLDFGYTHPCALVRVYVCDDGLWFEEVIYETGLTPSTLIQRMHDMNISKSRPIYPDPAEPGQILDLKRAGYNVREVSKEPGSVRAGIATMMSHKKHVAPGSENLKSEFDSYAWKRGKDDRPVDEPVKERDDGLDACRYAVRTHLGTRRRLKVFDRRVMGA